MSESLLQDPVSVAGLLAGTVTFAFRLSGPPGQVGGA
jgi:hypothetical protein